MKLATLDRVSVVIPHPNADRLDIACVGDYRCIVPKGLFEDFEDVVLIHPDTILPDADWAKPYKRGDRVKAVKIRGEWSFGLAIPLSELPEVERFVSENGVFDSTGVEVSHMIGVKKYEPPIGNDLQAIGPLPFGMFKTDEERYQNLQDLPWGELVDVTLKVDGMSMTVYCKTVDGKLVVGLCSRNQELRTTCDNKFTRFFNGTGMEQAMKALRWQIGFDFALRGELCGRGVQSSKHNPHSVDDRLSFFVFDILNLDTLEIQRKGSDFYFKNVIDGAIVDFLEKDVVLTPELIKKYEQMERLPSGQLFEGVVIKHSNGSFKVINLKYDSLK